MNEYRTFNTSCGHVACNGISMCIEPRVFKPNIGLSSNGRKSRPERVNGGSIPSKPAKHIFKEGARYHVISWGLKRVGVEERRI